jgi:hypothetical protein
MESQTIAVACIAALYPVGLLAVSLLLASDRPMRLGLSFYAGAFTTLFVVGVLMITVMHGAGSNSSEGARGGFRMGIGAAMLVAAWVLLHRTGRRRRADKEPAWKVRLRAAQPVPIALAGAVLYSPSGSYLGAMTSIATGNGGWPWVAQLLVVIAIVLITVESPLLAYALWPGPTARTLARLEGWIERHGREALILALLVIGGYLFIDGITLVV